MKLISKYDEFNLTSKEDVFEYFMSYLKDTIRTYNFFVAWDKVLGNVSNIEVRLNILNSLIGKSNIEEELKKLIFCYPEVVPVFPLLIAVREKNIKVIDSIFGEYEYSFIMKNEYSESEIEDIVHFARECGVLKILQNKEVKNLVDYCVGVEVGLDTNARKNRSGTEMEKLVEAFIFSICTKYNYEYLTQATASKIKFVYNKDIPTDKADRRFDFVINTPSKLYLIEVNYYSGGGSKLKSVAGEFKNLFELTRTNSNVGFIWITDGKGWETAKRSFEETFNTLDYVLNLKLVEDGLLEEIITKEL